MILFVKLMNIDDYLNSFEHRNRSKTILSRDHCSLTVDFDDSIMKIRELSDENIDQNVSTMDGGLQNVKNRGHENIDQSTCLIILAMRYCIWIDIALRIF